MNILYEQITHNNAVLPTKLVDSNVNKTMFFTN